jgi:outer membrane protein
MGSIKKYLFIPAAIILLFSNAFSQELSWNLQRCMDHASDHNLAVRQSELNVNASKNALTGSKLNLLPVISASANHNYNFGRSIDPVTNTYVNQAIQTNRISASGNLNIFSGFRNLNVIKQNKYNLNSSNYQLQQTIQDTKIQVVGIYIQILSAREQVKIMEEQLLVMQDLLSNNRELYKTGYITKGKLLSIEAQLKDDEFRLISARNEEQRSLLDLKRALQIEPEISIVIADTELETGFQYSSDTLVYTDIYNNAYKRSPGIKSAQYDIKSAESAIEVTRSSYYPTLSLISQIYSNYNNSSKLPGTSTPYYYYGGSIVPTLNNVPVASVGYHTDYVSYPFSQQLKDNTSSYIGLSLNIPILNGLQSRNAVNASKINRSRTNLYLENEKTDLKNMVSRTILDSYTAKQEYNNSLKNVESAEEAFKYVEEELKVGSATIFDFSYAKNILYRSKSELIQSKYNYIFRHKILEILQGNL